jgi:hypothetical protein
MSVSTQTLDATVEYIRANGLQGKFSEIAKATESNIIPTLSQTSADVTALALKKRALGYVVCISTVCHPNVSPITKSRIIDPFSTTGRIGRGE